MMRTYGNRELPSSAFTYVLESLVPYTDANIKLAFKPHAFFNDLERISRQKAWQKSRRINFQLYKRDRLRTAYYRCKRRGMITIDSDGRPHLTAKGKQLMKPYVPRLLGNQARLMVVFDIPEADRTKRRHLRLLLKELKFKKIQQSVWVSAYDHRKILTKEINALDINQYVQVYESLRII